MSFVSFARTLNSLTYVVRSVGRRISFQQIAIGFLIQIPHRWNFKLYNMLTPELLSSFDRGASLRHGVKVYTAGGTQIGLAGLGGEGDELLTIPACWIMDDALQSSHWARFSTA